jgi:hypothetical protein
MPGTQAMCTGSRSAGTAACGAAYSAHRFQKLKGVPVAENIKLMVRQHAWSRPWEAVLKIATLHVVAHNKLGMVVIPWSLSAPTVNGFAIAMASFPMLFPACAQFLLDVLQKTRLEITRGPDSQFTGSLSTKQTPPESAFTNSAFLETITYHPT